ncbi:MAG: T9SS type A sorting domain-containing protein [Ignavibacteriales bacterium]|nr:MAG: T9SS type A sorting domain-containing protein [Ignavibacteriales bacterium]
MKIFRLFPVLFLLISFNISAQQDVIINPPSPALVDFLVVPSDYANTPGTAAFTGPLATTARTYQLLIEESLLTTIIGKEIQTISFRIPVSATANWPAAETIYSSFDVYLSGSVTPSARSLTFIDNIVGPQKLCRSGSLTIPTDSYPFGGSPVNGWGREIMLDSFYLYTGGHLLIEIRHSGYTGTSRSLDAIGTTTTGYGTLFSACWQSGYTATTGLQGNFSINRLAADDPVPVELVSFTGDVFNNSVNLSWSTATETNNSGFEIERKQTGNESWNVLGFVEGAGTTTEQQNYFYADRNITAGTYQYRLRQIDFDGSFEYSSVVEVEVLTPAVYSLDQNYPNPFNPSTNIIYSIAEAGFVKLAVYDALGQEVKILVNEFIEGGQHDLSFDASSLPSGTYFYKLETAKYSETKKMLLMK